VAVVWTLSSCVCVLSSVQYLIQIVMKRLLWFCEFDAMFVSVLWSVREEHTVIPDYLVSTNNMTV